MGIFYTNSQYGSGMRRYCSRIILLFLFLGFSIRAMAQQQVIFQPTKTLTPIVRDKPVTVKTVNLLDVDPQFKRKPIKFVPFKATKEAEAKGLKLDSIYVWTDPSGNKKTASGKKILEDINEFEKELNKRGHSLRDKEQLKYIRADMKHFSTETTVSAVNLNKFAKIRGTDIGNATVGINPKAFNFYNFLYFGRFENFSGEFPDQLETVYNMQLTSENPIILPVSIALHPVVANQAVRYELELYESPNDKKPRYIRNFDFKPLAEYEITDKMRRRQIRGGIVPGKNYKIYYLKHNLKTSPFGLPSASYKVKKYYPRIKLYDKNGTLLKSEPGNSPVLSNHLYDWVMPVDHYSNINAFDESVTDPITKTFGFYMKSDGYAAYAHHYTSKANKTVEDSTRISGHFDMGIKMYNWANLFDQSKPKTQNLSLFNIEIEGINGRVSPTNQALPIDNENEEKKVGEDKNIKVYYSFVGEKKKLLTESVHQPYRQVLFDQRFMLGPVPCRATINMDGSMGINYGGHTNLGTTSKINTTIEPYANLNINGSGGADAVVAYAKILAKIDLVDMNAPMIFFAESNKKANVDSKMTISCLSGEIGFKAGVCIPIPFFDDICKEFRINIFNWSGLNETIDFREDL